ncbi:MAG TPA: Gfo/Idh/MocA family oxidoreductase [Tepidisphaeraceae bacterium]|nr:Gfo/Idh/MocA family oxidoreductase [Tepidisphaeraceae bacterium]
MTQDQNASSPLKVGVIGCGRMGRLHARVYSEMPGIKLVGVHDLVEDAAAAVADSYSCKAFKTAEELIAQTDAITLAVPTVAHAELAYACLRRGVACLIEKPLAKDVHDARRIAADARKYGVTAMVGHIERFNPVMRAVNRLGIRPRFIEVIRISPMTFRSIDVGVVLDVMIHDIDIVLRLAESKVSRIDAIGVSVIGEVEDICNARLTFENGCVANMTASRLALKTERRMRLFSPDAYVSLDYQKRYGLVARRGKNVGAIREAAEKIRSGQITDLSELNYADLVHVEELQIDDIEPLRAELESFISSIRNRTTPEVSVEDGLAAVETATRVVESIAPGALKALHQS